MNNAPELLLAFLEDLNELFVSYDSEDMRNNIFKRIEKALLSKNESSVIQDDKQILILLHEHSKTSSPVIAKRLLATFCNEIEKKDKPNLYISTWFTKNMKQVLDGKDFREEFGLKHAKSGRPKGTKSTPVLQVVAAHEFYLRETDKSATKIKEKIQEDIIGITEKEINRSIAALKIPKHIETGVLKELMKRDYSAVMGHGH